MEFIESKWVTSIVESNLLGYAQPCSLAFDSADNPIIATSTNGRIWVRRRDANGSWSKQEIGSGTGCSLSLNRTPSGDEAWIVFSGEGRMWVAKALLGDAAPWTVQVAEGDGAGARYPSLQLHKDSATQNVTPHLGYFLGSDLRYSKADAGYRGPSWILQDDMEDSSVVLWTPQGNSSDTNGKSLPPGPSNGTSLWHLTTRRSADAGHSAVTSWYYGREDTGTYHTGHRNWGRLVSSPIALGSTAQPGSWAEFKFSHLARVEGGRAENAQIQVSLDNGGTWATILTRASTSGTGFVTEKIDLTPYLGKTILIGFFLDTKDANFNGYEGWYIDDVTVKWWP
jgi:hypothetical protein